MVYSSQCWRIKVANIRYELRTYARNGFSFVSKFVWFDSFTSDAFRPYTRVKYGRFPVTITNGGHLSVRRNMKMNTSLRSTFTDSKLIARRLPIIFTRRARRITRRSGETLPPV